MSGTRPLLASFTRTLAGGAAPAHGGMTLIVIVVDTVTSPALAEAVMAAPPRATPVTRPAAFTVATAVFEDDHVVSAATVPPSSSRRASCTTPFTGMLLDGASMTTTVGKDVATEAGLDRSTTEAAGRGALRTMAT